MKNVKTLLPKMQDFARKWYAACKEAGLKVVIICGTRTYEEQDALYAIGRTAPGRKVTNARGGYSNHNFGVAFDFVIFPDVDDSGGVGKPAWDSPDMDKAGGIAKEMGLEWGGVWRFVDKPHVQWKTGKTVSQLRQMVSKNIPII